jgi:N-methylhydantoinase A
VQIGVDIGGTFTDIVALDSEGRLVLTKVPTTPKDLPKVSASPCAACST